MKELDLWIFIYNKINRNLKVNLLIVSDSLNSSSSRPSFKMAVSEDTDTYGSIGGGVFEFNILNEIRGTLSNTEPVNLIKILLNGEFLENNYANFKFVGKQSLIVFTINKFFRDVIKKIIDNFEEHKNGVLKITQRGFDFIPARENQFDVSIDYESEHNWNYEENIGLLNTVYIIGGGHIGLALSRIMSTLDFFVIVFDQRDDIITMRQNKYANKKIVTTYSNVNKYIKESKKSYVIIVTSDYETDKDVVKSLVSMDLKYIGMMGNEKKLIYIQKYLQEEGINFDLFLKINCPIGINIKANTPEESAISIIAEIIKIKNE